MSDRASGEEPARGKGTEVSSPRGKEEESKSTATNHSRAPMGAGTQVLLTPRLPLSLCPRLPPGRRGRRIADSVLIFRQTAPALGGWCRVQTVSWGPLFPNKRWEQVTKTPVPAVPIRFGLKTVQEDLEFAAPLHCRLLIPSSSNVTSPVKPSRKLQEPPQPSPQLPPLSGVWDILVSRARLKDALFRHTRWKRR